MATSATTVNWPGQGDLRVRVACMIESEGSRAKAVGGGGCGDMWTPCKEEDDEETGVKAEPRLQALHARGDTRRAAKRCRSLTDCPSLP